MRRAMTGMTDEQLTLIGYISVLWNALERNMVAAIFAAAEWEPDVGDLVTADLQNVSRANLLMNFVRKNVKGDERLINQTQDTLALLDLLRGSRNDLMHGFFDYKHQTSSPASLLKLTTKRRTGAVEIKSVSVSLSELEDFATDLHICNESLNDLYHKLHFRNRWNAGERGVFAEDYENAVHGWREPSLDISFVQECLKKRSQRPNPPRPKPQRPPSRQRAQRQKTAPD